jgi:hypothetical protein
MEHTQHLMTYVWVDVILPSNTSITSSISPSYLATFATPSFSKNFISGDQCVEEHCNDKVDMGDGKGHEQPQWQERWMGSSSAWSWSMGDGKGHGHWQEKWMPSSSFRCMGEGKGHGHGQRKPSRYSHRRGKGKGQGHGQRKPQRMGSATGPAPGNFIDIFDESNYDWSGCFVPEYNGTDRARSLV